MATRSFSLTLLLLCALQAPSAAQAIQPGDPATHTFRSAPLGGDGLERLEDLRGRPVLVEFWGIRCPPCINSAVPSAIKMAETYRGELAVLLVESQGHTLEQVATFALDRKWFGSGAMWTTERPFQTGARGIPNYALLSAEGRVLIMGNPITDHKRINDAIALELRRARAVPDGTPRDLTGAWREFGRGNLGRALSQAARHADSQDAELAQAATEALATFRSHFASRIGRANWLADNGRFHDADEAVKELSRMAKGDEELENRVSELQTRLADRSLQAERSAERLFLRLERTLFENGPSDALTRNLAQFAEKHQGTKAAERALFWTGLIGG